MYSITVTVANIFYKALYIKLATEVFRFKKKIKRKISYILIGWNNFFTYCYLINVHIIYYIAKNTWPVLLTLTNQETT